MKKVLIISEDVVSPKMGGTGVRSWELARTLARHFEVTLAVPNPIEMEAAEFRQAVYERTGDKATGGDPTSVGLAEAALDKDVIILQGFTLHFHPYLKEAGVPLAVDLYVPYLLENLVWHDREDWAEWIPEYEEFVRVQGELIRAGDFFFCASERQRDYWLGWLHAQKRINPHTYRQDASLRQLIDVVPFGIPEGEPTHTRAVLKGVHPGIVKDDRLIIWSGGMWDWLDPLTPIRAMKSLRATHPELKMYFMGTHHPNPILKGMEMPEQSIRLSQELGLFGETVFFGDWARYDERSNYLAEADLSVIAHPGHIETHFSHRTRVLDCIWAGIPMVISEGDALADLVTREGLGVAVSSGEVEQMRAGIEKVLKEIPSGRYAANFERVREQYRWEKAAQPLIDFCREPKTAVDKGQYLTAAEILGRDKDAFYEEVVRNKDAIIQRYQRSLPLRAYYLLKRALRMGRS